MSQPYCPTMPLLERLTALRVAVDRRCNANNVRQEGDLITVRATPPAGMSRCWYCSGWGTDHEGETCCGCDGEGIVANKAAPAMATP